MSFASASGRIKASQAADYDDEAPAAAGQGLGPAGAAGSQARLDFNMDFSLGSSSSSSSEEAKRSADAEVRWSAAAVKRAWISERSCPELLPYETKATGVLVDRIAEEQALLDEANDGKRAGLAEELRQMSVDRWNYVLTQYLRTRLKKIERFITYIMLSDMDGVRKRLSPAELDFATKYKAIVEENFNAGFLQSFPEKLRSLEDGGKIVDRPDLTEFVVVRFLEDTSGVAVDDKGGRSFFADDTVIASYLAVRDRILTGEAEFM